MRIGMLWFSNDPKKELKQKVEEAAAYYQEKYGRTPNTCFVHPTMINSSEDVDRVETLKVGGVEIRKSRSVLPNHFWLGRDEQA